MIVDKIENAILYSGLGESIAKALSFIRNTDFSKMDPGKHEIDGDRMFVMIFDYETKNKDDCQFEAHKKYIDVQYVASGVELFGYEPLIAQKPSKEYDEEKDFALFGRATLFTRFDTGMFAIFFPHDLHMPGVKMDAPSMVRKVVVKVRV